MRRVAVGIVMALSMLLSACGNDMIGAWPTSERGAENPGQTGKPGESKFQPADR